MDNLEQLKRHSIEINTNEYGKCTTCSVTEELICFVSDKNYICIYEHTDPHKLRAHKITDKEIKRIRYLPLRRVIVLITDFELIFCDHYTFRQSECYISEKKIIELAWNPTETAVVIIDENDKIVLYTFSKTQFDQQYTSNLNAEVPSSVYVGWGSENTQFQGPKSRHSKVKENVPLVELEYKPPRISWRGNGELFAVNYFRNGQRFIKVFDKHLQPLNVSLEYPNLIEPIAFMIAGQCIACATFGEVNTVVLFEKNCKVKSVFEVPENKGVIIKMRYHSQMNMLAVYSLDDKQYGYLNIYLNSNGVWNLKQQMYFPPNRVIEDFEWENLQQPLYTICRLILLTSQSIEYYTFRFIINRCPGTSLVSVIDGRNILWYNFAEKIVPLPISNYSLVHSRPINRILFHPQKLLCVAIDSVLQTLIIDLKNYTKLLMSKHLDLTYALSFHSVVWNDDNKIQIIFETSGEELVLVEKDCGVILEINVVKEIDAEFILPYNDTNCLTSHINLEIQNKILIYLSKKILTVKNCEVEIDFALSSDRELYINEQLLWSGVTSIFIFQDYFLFTMVTCKLYCIRLLQNYEALLLGRLDLENIYSREIEQGARIVTVSNGYPPRITVVLPRGNLETFSCRLLTVDIIEKLLTENKWKTVVDLTRTERMNWNLLIDLNPERFSNHIKDFVEAAEFCTNLSMIVNDFTNKNSFYKNCLPNSQKECDKTIIVKQIINHLTATDLTNNLLSIVSIHQKHFSLKSALNYIKTVFELNPKSDEVVCKKALQLLSNKGYFKDIVEATYSLYSLDFLTFVYHNSSEDPRIYEPEIATFRSLKPIELRFKMSLRANNPREAVKYLLRCENYDTAFIETFILKHKLQDVAYKCLPSFYGHFKIVSVLYAKHLSLKQKHSEAALILKKARLMTEALEEYKEALDWREVLSILPVLNYDENQRKDFLYKFCDKLSRAHKVDEAALLLDKYLDDYKRGIQVFVEHKAFRKAVCLAKEHNATEMLDELVIPALKSYMSLLKDKIDEHEALFKKYFNRLQTLREEKKTKLDNCALGFYEANDDLYSETGSTVSSFGSSRATSRSRSSQLSSKNRRKEARKKIDLREGGYYEDIALIRALHILYIDLFSLGKDVREVCLIWDHGDVQLAKTLHSNLDRLQDVLKRHIPLIWPDIFINTPQLVDNTILAVIGNKADLDLVYCTPPVEEILSQTWKLDLFL